MGSNSHFENSQGKIDENWEFVRAWLDFVGASNQFVYKCNTSWGERIPDSQVN